MTVPADTTAVTASGRREAYPLGICHKIRQLTAASSP